MIYYCKTDHFFLSALAALISSLMSSRLISESPLFFACSRSRSKAFIAPSLVISGSGEEISNGILLSLTTALAKILIRLLSDVMLWHENCIKSMEEEIGKHKEVIGNLESYVRELSLCDE